MTTAATGARNDAAWLYCLAVCLACGLLVAWTTYRVKPVLWFGLLFGLVFGAVTLVLRSLLAVPAGRRSMWGAALLASLGVAASVGIAAERARLAASQRGSDMAAGALIQMLERLPPESDSMPTPADLTHSASQHSVENRLVGVLNRRYADWPGLPPWGWGLVELLVAGASAGLVVSVGTSRQRGPQRPEEPQP